jgi:adenine-specific DNA methylase
VARPIFRPVQYLGSKLRVVDAITSIAREIVAPGSSVTDLFAGSSVVAQSLARAGFRTTAIDTQTYATIFCRALLGVKRAPKETIDAEPVLAAAARLRKTIARDWLIWQEREDTRISAGDGAGLRKLDAELPLAWRRGQFVADREAALASFYAGSYFGVRQALDLDTIRAAIAASPDLKPGTWQHAAATTALMHATSLAVHSAGKHFAQPLKGRAANAHFLNARLLSDRTLNIPDLFAVGCAAVNNAAPCADEGHVALTGEAENYLAVKRGHSLHYLDPPYTAQQYSRFYHILETIATAARPSLPYDAPPSSGLYPSDRYKSAFSSRRKAPIALAQLLSRIADERGSAIISYSISARGSDGNERMISLEELLAASHDAFGPKRVELVDLEHRYRQFNSSDNANASRNDKEVLLVCKPA